MEQKLWVCDDEPSERHPVWTRGNVGEVFVEAVSPLTWSLFGVQSWEPGWRDAFFHMGVFVPADFRPPGECEICGCFGGYIYINMSVTRVMAVRVPGLTVEAMDRSLFGDHAGAPPYRPDPRDVSAERMAAAGAWLATLFTDDPGPATDQDRIRLDALVALRPGLAAVTDAQLLERARGLTPEGRRLFRRHVLNTYGANVLSSVIAQASAAAGAADRVSAITAGIGEVESAAQSLDLWALSRQVWYSQALRAAFDQGTGDLLPRLRSDGRPVFRRFLSDWDAFIDRWGFLGPSAWEIRSPTWRADPAMALRMLDRACRAPDSASPGARAAAFAAARDVAVAEVAARLAGDPRSRSQFLAAAASVGRHLAARERSKTHCARLIDEARAVLRELGTRMVRRGVLARWEDVLLVTDAEADDFLANPGAWQERLQTRAARLEWLKSREPPFVFEGAPPGLPDFQARDVGDVAPAGPGESLVGLGVSPGRHTGRARVIESLEVDSELEPGDVIVTATTDSAWGPLFLTAGAVVVETGAAISHAAIVSRELGIPAVVSVAGATRRLRNGCAVTVDGGTGTVSVQ